MARVEFGLFLHPGPLCVAAAGGDAYLDRRAAAIDAIDGAFDAVWLMDHLALPPWEVLECWTHLGHLAERYPRLRFGPMVLNQGFRNPALLAKMAATFQYLTGGRLILALGAGNLEAEHRAFGYPFPPPGERVSRLAEALRVLRALWREPSATVAGHVYAVTDAVLTPTAPPPPLLVAAEGPRTLRLAARYADWWSADWLAPADYRALAERLDAACAAEGRDPATLRKTALTVVSCAPSERAARAALADSPIPSRQPLDNALVGTPGQVLAQLRPYLAAGAEYIIVTTPQFPGETTLTLLRDEVLPALRGGG